MAIRRRGSSWEIDYYAPDPKNPGKNRRVKKLFPLKREAEAELAKRKSLVAEGRYLDVKTETKTTFEELAARYEETFKHQRSFDRAKRGFIKTLKARFSGRMLSSLTYYDCEAFLTERRNTPTRGGKPRTESTLNKEVGTLRHMLAKAVSWGFLERSPFSRGESLHLKENNQRLRFLNEEEAERLVAKCSDHLRPIVLCALNTGMRKGEILALKWEDVRNGFIYVRKSKTDEARQIPINDTLAEMLKGLRVKNQLQSPYVFCIKSGGKLTNIGSVQRSFERARKKADIDDFRFHDLRHTFASWLVMRGASLKVVQELLGHKSLTMTLRYSHLAEAHKVEAVNLLCTRVKEQSKAAQGPSSR